jgi:hypothetical protein
MQSYWPYSDARTSCAFCRKLLLVNALQTDSTFAPNFAPMTPTPSLAQFSH